MNTRTSRCIPRALGIVVVLAFAGVAPQASAQWAVIDAKAIAESIKQFEKMKEQLAAAKSQINEAQKLYDSLQSLEGLNPLASALDSEADLSAMLEERDSDYLLEERCPGAEGGVGGLLEALSNPATLVSGGSIREEQLRICSQIVRIENHLWNENVMAIEVQELHRERAKEAARSRDAGAEQGEADTRTGDVFVVGVDQEADMEMIERRIHVFENALESLNKTQGLLAQQLMAGRNRGGLIDDLAGDVVQGAALKAALEAGD